MWGKSCTFVPDKSTTNNEKAIDNKHVPLAFCNDKLGTKSRVS